MKKLLQNVNKGNLAMIIFIFVILGIFLVEVYSVTHIELKTQTAGISTVYDTISANALVVRNETVIPDSGDGITVVGCDNGDKIKKGGSVAMVFSSEQEAVSYSKYRELSRQLAQYESLVSQTVGQSADLETVDKDIEQKVVDYALSLDENNINDEKENLNSVLIRRQILIGEQVDLQSYVTSLTNELSQYDAVAPKKQITTDVSGVFSTYTDGFEGLVDYDSAVDMSVDEFKSIKEKIDSSTVTQSGNIGKVITEYNWYLQALVDSERVKNLENGDYVEVVLKGDSNTVLNAKIVTGAEPELNNTQTLLVLRCDKMDESLAELRCADIAIRLKKHEGIKVPADALHVVDGKKGVYVLIASQVKFRQVNVIYSDNDYVLVEYDSSVSNGIHLYDKIITQGKDLEDGKVYT